MKLSLTPRFRRHPRTTRSSSNRRPLLECLEDRLAPAASFTATALVDGYFTSDRLNTTGNEIRLDLSADRGLLEFDISSLPPTAVITSATLTGKPTLVQFNSEQNRVSTIFYTYSGDGSLSPADAAITNGQYGGLLTTSSLDSFSIPIQTGAIQPLVGTTNYLGIQAQKVIGEQIWLASVEGATPADRPQLTINYTHQPVGTADAYSMNEDGMLSIGGPGVLGNDSDADGNPITAFLIKQANDGTVTLNSDGSFIYRPRANFNGIDRFTYRVRDSDGQTISNATTVTITVNPVADAPVAVNDTFTVAAGKSTVISAVTPATSPLLQYGFDEGVNAPNSSAAMDTGLFPRADGTFVGPALRIAQTPGSFSRGALDLTAPGHAYVDAGDSAKLDNLSAMTLTAWVNLRNATKQDVYNPLMSDNFMFAPAGDVGWMLGIAGWNASNNLLPPETFRLILSVTRAEENSSSSRVVESPAYSSGGDWVFIAMTFDASGLVSFFQGGPRTTASQFGRPVIVDYQLGNNSSPFQIGTTSTYFSGDYTPPVWMDDVRVYGTALTPTQVEQVRSENAAAGVLGNDHAPDGGSYTPMLVTGPSNGSLTLNSDGSFEYTPNTGFIGIDTFSYKIHDSQSESNIATVTLMVTEIKGPTASFVGIDSNTQGTWTGTYGKQGFSLAQDTSGGTTGIPSYASVTLRGQNTYTWTASTTDPAALERSPNSPTSDRFAATWYADQSFEIDVRIQDGQTHQIALYALDWHDGTRSQTIQLFNTETGALLDTRSIANFANGVYLVWNITSDVTIKVTKTEGPNAVLSGLFFDSEAAPTSADFLRVDPTTKGSWKTLYGGDGHYLAQDASGGAPNTPSYASVTFRGQNDYIWSANTNELAALEKTTGLPADRLAASWYASNSFEIDIWIRDGQTHQVALYALDWLDGTRSQTIQLFDTVTGTLLSSHPIADFANGVYLVWALSGRVTVKVTSTAGPNAVLSGLFFDPLVAPATTARFVKADTTTQGAWKSDYGRDGYNLAQDTSTENPSLPSYASVRLRGQNDYTWATSTTHAAALEKSTGVPPDRLAAAWYADQSFEIDVRIKDGQTHQIALYALDWLDGSRNQTIQLFDTITGDLLDIRTIANFQDGVYLVWNVTGRVTIRMTKNVGPNAVLSGLFFG